MASKKAAEQTQPATPAEAPKAAAPTGMQIVAMQVDNIKRVSCVRIRPKGQVVTIAGENGSGKSSILDAIEMAITGTRSIPTMPIKKGQKSASIRINFGDFEVVRDFTHVEGGKEPFLTKLSIFGRHKEKYPQPQAMLDGFMGAISFDPLAFIRMAPAKQLETLRKLVTLDVDLDALELEKKTAYDARRDAGRDVDSAKARLAALPEPPDGLPEKPINTGDLTKKLQDAANHNSIIGAREVAKQGRIDQAKRDRDSAEAKRAEAKRLREEADWADVAARTFDEAAEAGIKEAQEMVIGEKTDTAEVAAEITAANLTNGAIQRRDAYLSIKKQVEEAEATWTAHDTTVKAKEKERADAIARAKMPIEGLGIGDGEVTYNGFPFDQASNAAQIKASVALAIASNPTLRVLRIKDGSLLDQKTLTMISEMATETGYQIWIERVDTTGKVGVVMEDGEASGEDVEEPFREEDKLKKA